MAATWILYGCFGRGWTAPRDGSGELEWQDIRLVGRTEKLLPSLFIEGNVMFSTRWKLESCCRLGPWWHVDVRMRYFVEATAHNSRLNSRILSYRDSWIFLTDYPRCPTPLYYRGIRGEGHVSCGILATQTLSYVLAAYFCKWKDLPLGAYGGRIRRNGSCPFSWIK